MGAFNVGNLASDTEHTSNESDFSSDDSLIDKDYVPPTEEHILEEEEIEDIQEEDTPEENRTENGQANEDNIQAEGSSVRKKRKINTRKEQKKLRDHGKEAKTRKGKVIPGKEFHPAVNCCHKKCFEKINEEQQKTFF